ncbi:hypothetical protein L2E82_04678 [Cichorium intybus]|uniref:Uncharacterized protein n=1 Tax=Cichorium intybus TaxID=13427 RepID=A0ACB9H6C7_CICIN|nr:hypothetical protein L2E82_04678 [Cichorium intybus]
MEKRNDIRSEAGVDEVSGVRDGDDNLGLSVPDPALVINIRVGSTGTSPIDGNRTRPCNRELFSTVRLENIHNRPTQKLNIKHNQSNMGGSWFNLVNESEHNPKDNIGGNDMNGNHSGVVDCFDPIQPGRDQSGDYQITANIKPIDLKSAPAESIGESGGEEHTGRPIGPSHKTRSKGKKKKNYNPMSLKLKDMVQSNNYKKSKKTENAKSTQLSPNKSNTSISVDIANTKTIGADVGF